MTDIKALKTRAHALKTVVWLGQHGLTDAVLVEVEGALHAHELIKIKIPAESRALRLEIAQEILTKTKSELVQLMGSVATFYRKKNDLPKNPVKKTKAKR